VPGFNVPCRVMGAGRIDSNGRHCAVPSQI
jgi:hypothetical protein